MKRHLAAATIVLVCVGRLGAQDGPAAASTWLNFMQANDGNLVREACAKSTFKTADGRRACAVGLWVDPPTQPAPPYRGPPVRQPHPRVCRGQRARWPTTGSCVSA